MGDRESQRGIERESERKGEGWRGDREQGGELRKRERERARGERERREKE